MSHRPSIVGTLLFFSGASALIYQTVWLREFRLIFGASTASTAAVLAVFMAGLGLGSAILGRRADARTAPLAFYGRLELMIAAAAVLSLPLLWLARLAYIGAGGSTHLGFFFATVVRLLIAAVVLGPATLLMGGTLPAAARAVESASDSSRRNVALLYGMNTLGAVAGTLLSTFVLLEMYGNRRTLLIAALVNAAIALIARSLSRRSGEVVEAGEAGPAPDNDGERVPPILVLSAAAAAGLAFLLMELVWYRMLGPLLGGTTFTFGLILAFALAGIGIGGLAYRGVRPTAGALAVTSSLEAFLMIVPFAAGDRIAAMATILRESRVFGFSSYMLGWSLVAAIVVLPAAILSGIQFPLLIGLLGRGRRLVGRDVGAAYAWNTAGSIAGSLAGGFGLLPLLSAPGAWRAAAILLALLGAAIAVQAGRSSQRTAAAFALVFALLTIVCATAEGPTALWRHSGIGVGRLVTPVSLNQWRDMRNEYRRRLLWDEDGKESSIALMSGDDYAFVVNGKPDGSATGDAGTQLMGGLLAAILHPAPKSGLVIGVGTGMTTGWLASVPTIERVDGVELEPVVLRVARDCAVVNRNVLSNPKVHVIIGDGREVLLTTRQRYDVIFSEPSNPYRAGVASLFTQEFYRAVADRLAPGGIFVQWMQAYDIDAATSRTIYGTLGTVFPHVDTFWPMRGDLLLVATREPLTYDMETLRQRLATEPYRSALANAWGIDTAEGFLSHLIANENLAHAVGKDAEELNTDDRTVIEYSFARALVANRVGVFEALQKAADDRGLWQPSRVKGPVDWHAWLANRASTADRPIAAEVSTEFAQRHEFALAYAREDLKLAAQLWQGPRWQPVNLMDAAALAESLADTGDESAIPLSDALRAHNTSVPDAIAARLRMTQGRFDEASVLLQRSFIAYRKNPWTDRAIMRRALQLAIALCRRETRQSPALYEALREPFSTGQSDAARKTALLTIASDREGCGSHTIAALQLFEPYPPWHRDHLELRARCYAAANLADLAERARKDLEEFEAADVEALLK